ncbi:hypothetical protein MHYP_G00103650 [Metynnis hypsauchen]
MDEAGMTEKILHIFTLFLISVAGGESETVMGYSGGGVLIKCRYETQYTSNQKYFCKGSTPNCADQIKTGDKKEWINSGRFSLFDDTGAAQFWVLIKELTVEDSGTYQCGVDKDLAIDVYIPVELNVEEDQDYKKNISVTGHAGGSVNISCNYPKSHSSDPKFLCGMMGTVSCAYKSFVKESRRWINNGKVSLYDERAKKIFTVRFNSLTEGDSGEYWCGAESDWTSDHGYKVYTTQINLTVTDSPPPAFPVSSVVTGVSVVVLLLLTGLLFFILTLRKRNTTQDSPPPAFPVSSVVTGVSVVVLLLLIGLLFFIVTLRKRNTTQGPASTQSQSHRGSSDKHTDSRDVCVYEEVKDISSSDAGASTVYSTAELPTNPSEPSQSDHDNIQLPSSCDFSNPIYSPAQLPSNSPDQDIYSTAQLPTVPSDSPASATQRSSGTSAEGPTYATVNFGENADSSTDAVTTATINKEINSCDYATVKY